MARFDISIAGEINLDLILYGLPQEMPVERELLASDFQLTLGSSSAILAHNLAALGLKVAFVTRVGSDPLGKIALERLREKGVDLSRVVHSTTGTKTGVTFLLNHQGERHILTYPGTMFEMVGPDLDLEYLSSARHFHLSALFLHRGLQRDLPAILRRLKDAGLTLSLDTNDDPEDRWEGCLEELLDTVDILLPNEYEACRIARVQDVNQALDILGRRVKLIAVKCGSRGAIVQANGERWTVPPIPVTPVDTIGAGDSFDAGFLAAFLQGKTPEQCAAFGNRTAALSTLRPGGTESYRDTALFQEFFSQHGAMLK